MTKKGKFLERINEAFAKSDTGYIIKKVTGNIRWIIVGDHSVELRNWLTVRSPQ